MLEGMKSQVVQFDLYCRNSVTKSQSAKWPDNYECLSSAILEATDEMYSMMCNRRGVCFDFTLSWSTTRAEGSFSLALAGRDAILRSA